MTAAMVHGGGGVLLMMTAKFASQKTSKNYKITKPMQSKPLILTTISKPKQQHKITSKNNQCNKHPAPSNNLTVEIQYFEMRKMDQR